MTTNFCANTNPVASIRNWMSGTLDADMVRELVQSRGFYETSRKETSAMTFDGVCTSDTKLLEMKLGQLGVAERREMATEGLKALYDVRRDGATKSGFYFGRLDPIGASTRNESQKIQVLLGNGGGVNELLMQTSMATFVKDYNKFFRGKATEIKPEVATAVMVRLLGESSPQSVIAGITSGRNRDAEHTAFVATALMSWGGYLPATDTHPELRGVDLLKKVGAFSQTHIFDTEAFLSKNGFGKTGLAGLYVDITPENVYASMLQRGVYPDSNVLKTAKVTLNERDSQGNTYLHYLMRDLLKYDPSSPLSNIPALSSHTLGMAQHSSLKVENYKGPDATAYYQSLVLKVAMRDFNIDMSLKDDRGVSVGQYYKAVEARMALYDRINDIDARAGLNPKAGKYFRDDERFEQITHDEVKKAGNSVLLPAAVAVRTARAPAMAP